MKKLRLFDSLKFVVAAIVCTFMFVSAHADNTWKYAPLPIGYVVNSDLVELTESNESFNTYTVKKTTNTAKRMLYITNANPLPANHKYFMRARFNSNLANLPYFRYMLDGTYTNLGYGAGYNTSCRKNEWCNVAQIITPQQELNLNGVSDGLLAANNSYTAGETITIDKNGFLTVFDLTEIFGAGNEPTTVADAEQALSIDTTIKIATTRYNEEQFEPVQNRLSDAMDAVDDVVTRTMSQAQAIDQIATSKQTRPDEGCTAKYCLLVEDEDGTPHWYPIAGANGVAHALPAGYTELQYIESTGTQYIDTGITGGAGLSVDMVVQGTGDKGIIFGFDQDWTGACVGDNGTDFKGPGIFTGISSLVKTDITTYWESENSKLKQTTTINGVTKSGMYSRTPVTIELFKGAAWSAADSFWAGKIFSFLLKRNGVAIRNFIPTKNSDNVVGMYDMVSGQFFTNAGTGTFVAGPDM